MNWPGAFVLVGVMASVSFVIWSIMRYGRTEIEVSRVERREGDATEKD